MPPTLDWRPGPAPRRGPFLARSKGAAAFTHHTDDWMVAEIHGPDYEWAPIPQ